MTPRDSVPLPCSSPLHTASQNTFSDSHPSSSRRLAKSCRRSSAFDTSDAFVLWPDFPSQCHTVRLVTPERPLLYGIRLFDPFLGLSP